MSDKVNPDKIKSGQDWVADLFQHRDAVGVIHPAYRGSGIGHDLVFHGQEMARLHFGMDAIFGETVCNHLFMQKLLLSIGWAKTSAIEVDLMPAEAYSREKSAAGRVTALIDFVLFQKSPQSVYVPDECREMIQGIYQEFPDERYLHPAIDDIPSSNRSEIALSVFDFSHVARITIQTAGADLAEAIDRAEASVLCQGVTVIQVWANLSWPWIGDVVNLLHSRGYFVGGVLPRWFDQDGILLQKLCHTPQWDHIQLLTDHAKRLLEYVRADYNRFCR